MRTKRCRNCKYFLMSREGAAGVLFVLLLLLIGCALLFSRNGSNLKDIASEVRQADKPPRISGAGVDYSSGQDAPTSTQKAKKYYRDHRGGP